MSNTGTKYEYELRDKFREDWSGGGIRVNSSGSGTKNPLPDVLGIVDGVLYACELKYRGKSSPRANFKQQEAEDLIRFAAVWGAEPCFVARFYRDKNFYAKRYYQMAEIEKFEKYDSFSLSKHKKEQYGTLEELIEQQREERMNLRNTTQPSVKEYDS